MNDLTYSESIYLLAESFSVKTGFLETKDTLPSGTRVSAQNLGVLVTIGAFLYLTEQKLIDFEIKKEKKFFIFPVEVLVVKKLAERDGLTSLEHAIHTRTGRKISHIIYAIINEDCSCPAGALLDIVKKALVAKTYLKVEAVKKLIFTSYVYSYSEKDTSLLNVNVEEIKQKLTQFANTTFYRLLVKQIEEGIKLRIEHPDNDD